MWDLVQMALRQPHAIRGPTQFILLALCQSYQQNRRKWPDTDERVSHSQKRLLCARGRTTGYIFREKQSGWVVFELAELTV